MNTLIHGVGTKIIQFNINIEIPVVYRFLQSIKDVSRKITLFGLND